MKPFKKIIQENLDSFQGKNSISQIEMEAIDSLEILVLRIALEKEIGREIKDSEWLELASLKEIREYYDNLNV